VAGNNIQKNKFMKLKQIDFNAELIGQEGIVVKTTDGQEPKQLTYFRCEGNSWPIIGVIGDELTHWRVSGEYYEDAERELSLEHEVHRLTLANVAAEEYIKLLEQRRY
jgi:hypothetical protein